MKILQFLNRSHFKKKKKKKFECFLDRITKYLAIK